MNATESAQLRSSNSLRLGGSNLALLLIGLIGVSSSGPLMAGATGVPALALAWWRTGLGAAAVAPFALTRHRAALAGLARREWVRSLFSGVMLAGHFAAWTTSLRFTAVASATALVCLQVAWVVLLARLSGVHILPGVWVGIGTALLGVVVVSGVDATVSARALTGDGLAVVGGVFGALYMVVGSRVREHTTTTAYTFVCYSTCAVVLLVTCLLGGVQLSGYDAQTWLLIVAVTASAQVLGHSVFNHLLAVMSPTLVSMVLLLEVPGAALLAAIFLSQAPPPGVYVGLVVICVGLAVVLNAGPSNASAEAPLD